MSGIDVLFDGCVRSGERRKVEGVLYWHRARGTYERERLRWWVERFVVEPEAIVMAKKVGGGRPWFRVWGKVERREVADRVLEVWEREGVGG